MKRALWPDEGQGQANNEPISRLIEMLGLGAVGASAAGGIQPAPAPLPARQMRCAESCLSDAVAIEVEYTELMRGREEESRRAHNPEIAGSNPVPATLSVQGRQNGKAAGFGPVNAGSNPAPEISAGIPARHPVWGRIARIAQAVAIALLVLLALCWIFWPDFAPAGELPTNEVGPAQLPTQVRQTAKVPEPDLSKQDCTVRTAGPEVLEIRCDSSRVCPPGWHLRTVMVHPLTGPTLQEILGYGDANEVVNSCVPSAAQAGVSQDGGRHYAAGMGVEK